MRGNRVKNDSKDWRYFVITPRLIWAMARTPFDLSLWYTVKDVAGDEGECYLSTPDLAVLSMMSEGQAHKSRKYWLSTGLMRGELKRDVGYPQPVWHLSIPDVWMANIEWATKYISIIDRVNWKMEQKRNLSPGESRKEHSPGERQHSPGEKGVSPGETKNNISTSIKKDDEEKNARFSEIVRSYEANIGPITPLISDALWDDFTTYYEEPDGPQWLGEAIETSVMNDVRTYKYIRACLQNRKKHGKDWKPKGNGSAVKQDIPKGIKAVMDWEKSKEKIHE